MTQTKKTTKGKGNSKSNSKANIKKTAKSKNKTIPGGSFNAVAALIIMGLITVIIMLVNDIYFGKNKKHSFYNNKVEVLKAQDFTVNRNIFKNKVPERDEQRKIFAGSGKAVNNNEKVSQKNEQIARKVQPKKKIKLYFVKLDNNSEKVYLSSVRRNVQSSSSLKDTLNELIKGPTAIEKKKGLLTAIPQGLKIKNIRVRNRTAEINFNDAIEHGGNGNILIKRIDQIVYTATQFHNVDSVLFKVNGKKKKSLGSDGLSISGPIHRRK